MPPSRPPVSCELSFVERTGRGCGYLGGAQVGAIPLPPRLLDRAGTRVGGVVVLERLPRGDPRWRNLIVARLQPPIVEVLGLRGGEGAGIRLPVLLPQLARSCGS